MALGSFLGPEVIGDTLDHLSIPILGHHIILGLGNGFRFLIHESLNDPFFSYYI